MKTLTCTCGKESVAIETSNVGEMMTKTGFIMVASHSGNITWLCKECYQKVHQLALEIHEIVKDEYLFFTGLLDDK